MFSTKPLKEPDYLLLLLFGAVNGTLKRLRYLLSREPKALRVSSVEQD